MSWFTKLKCKLGFHWWLQHQEEIERNNELVKNGIINEYYVPGICGFCLKRSAPPRGGSDGVTR